MRRRFSVLIGLAAVAATLAVVPAALANHLAFDVAVESATLGPGGSVIVSGTVQCEQGYQYNVQSLVRQRTAGNVYNEGLDWGQPATCSGGVDRFTTQPIFGSSPFHSGPATVDVIGGVCDDYTYDCTTDRDLKAVRIRR